MRLAWWSSQPIPMDPCWRAHLARHLDRHCSASGTRSPAVPVGNLVIEFGEQRGGDGAGDREPRIPSPDPGALAPELPPPTEPGKP
jgi:hypothetical protein